MLLCFLIQYQVVEEILKSFISKANQSYTTGHIYSRLQRCCRARRSSTKFSLVGTTKVRARNPYQFTESFLVLKIKKTWLNFDVTLRNIGDGKMRDFLSNHIICSTRD